MSRPCRPALAGGVGVAVPDRAGVQSQILGRGLNQAGQRGDEATGLVEVAVRALVGIGIGQAELLGGRAHQHDGGAGDHLDGGDLGELAHLVTG